MNECCHDFSAGKLLAVSCVHCVNCRWNPNHKPCALTPHPKTSGLQPMAHVP